MTQAFFNHIHPHTPLWPGLACQTTPEFFSLVIFCAKQVTMSSSSTTPQQHPQQHPQQQPMVFGQLKQVQVCPRCRAESALESAGTCNKCACGEQFSSPIIPSTAHALQGLYAVQGTYNALLSTYNGMVQSNALLAQQNHAMQGRVSCLENMLMRKTEDRVGPLQSKLRAVQEELRKARVQKKGVEQERAAMATHLAAKVTALARATESLEQAKNLRGRLEKAERVSGESTANVEKLQNQLAETSKQLAETSKQLEETSKQLAVSRAQLAETSKQLAVSRAQLDAANGETEQLRAANDKTGKEVWTAKEKARQFAASLELTERQLQTVRDELQKVQQSSVLVATASAAASKANERANNAKAETDKMSVKLAKAEEQASVLNKEVDGLKRQLSSMKSKLAAAELQCSKLQRESKKKKKTKTPQNKMPKKCVDDFDAILEADQSRHAVEDDAARASNKKTYAQKIEDMQAEMGTRMLRCASMLQRLHTLFLHIPSPTPDVFDDTVNAASNFVIKQRRALYLYQRFIQEIVGNQGSIDVPEHDKFTLDPAEQVPTAVRQLTKLRRFVAEHIMLRRLVSQTVYVYDPARIDLMARVFHQAIDFLWRLLDMSFQGVDDDLPPEDPDKARTLLTAQALRDRRGCMYERFQELNVPTNVAFEAQFKLHCVIMDDHYEHLHVSWKQRLQWSFAMDEESTRRHLLMFHGNPKMAFEFLVFGANRTLQATLYTLFNNICLCVASLSPSFVAAIKKNLGSLKSLATFGAGAKEPAHAVALEQLMNGSFFHPRRIQFDTLAGVLCAEATKAQEAFLANISTQKGRRGTGDVAPADGEGGKFKVIDFSGMTTAEMLQQPYVELDASLAGLPDSLSPRLFARVLEQMALAPTANSSRRAHDDIVMTLNTDIRRCLQVFEEKMAQYMHDQEKRRATSEDFVLTAKGKNIFLVNPQGGTVATTTPRERAIAYYRSVKDLEEGTKDMRWKMLLKQEEAKRAAGPVAGGGSKAKKSKRKKKK